MTQRNSSALPLATALREEWDALGLVSYHGSPWDRGNTNWYADLTPDDIGKIRALIRSAGLVLEAAEAFAVHDPGVEWPSEKHTDPVDAICAALDSVREELAVEVDR